MGEMPDFWQRQVEDRDTYGKGLNMDFSSFSLAY